VTAQVVTQTCNLALGIFHVPLNYNLNERALRNQERNVTSLRNTVLIYNPRAGTFGRRGAAAIERVVKLLESAGHTVTVAPTTGPATAGAIASEHISRGASLIVAAGGDGTINEVVEGMVHSQVPLAILPGGTANVLATELKLGNQIERIAESFAGLEPYRIPVGRITCDGGRVKRHFMLMAGIGLDAHIVYHVNQAVKARTGKLAYWLAGWSLLGRRLAEFRVEINGRERSCSFALVSRVRNYGGDFQIARGVTLLDDQFETILFEGRSSLRYVKYFTGMVLGNLVRMKGITAERTDRIVLSCAKDRRVYVQIDGEYAGRLPAEIRIVPDAITLLLPKEYARHAEARRVAAPNRA
jgi:diacylglycerol kinase (ATP)